MSILINDLAIPQVCEECRFCVDPLYACMVTLRKIYRKSDEDRPEWCPLVELPTTRKVHYICKSCGAEMFVDENKEANGWKFCSNCGNRMKRSEE